MANKTIIIFGGQLNTLKNEASNECIPFATLQDVLYKNENYSHLNGILLQPIDSFKVITDTHLKPVRKMMMTTPRQLMHKMTSVVDTNHLGLLLLVPRVLQCIVLLAGLFSSCFSVFTFDRHMIASAFGRLCIFSMYVVLGTQWTVGKMLSNIGMPFIRITVGYGLGFVFDILCDALMISIWIGMNCGCFFENLWVLLIFKIKCITFNEIYHISFIVS